MYINKFLVSKTHEHMLNIMNEVIVVVCQFVEIRSPSTSSVLNILMRQFYLNGKHELDHVREL